VDIEELKLASQNYLNAMSVEIRDEDNEGGNDDQYIVVFVDSPNYAEVLSIHDTSGKANLAANGFGLCICRIPKSELTEVGERIRYRAYPRSDYSGRRA
jgi:hypothetical protein